MASRFCKPSASWKAVRRNPERTDVSMGAGRHQEKFESLWPLFSHRLKRANCFDVILINKRKKNNMVQ